MHLDSHTIDARFVAYVESNDAPPPNILEDLIKARNLPLQELQDLDRSIRVLDITMGALKRRSEDIRKVLSFYEPILTPIRRLPEEMLEEVFYRCLPATRNARPFISESPLLLTVVCKKWRDIVHRSPRLWSTLHLPVPYDYLPPLDRNNPFTDSHAPLSPYVRNTHSSELHDIRNTELDKWLVRSGSLPLSISLFSSFTINDSRHWHPSEPTQLQQDQEYALQTLHLIVRHASRLSELEVVMPLETLQAFDKSLAKMGSSFSQLRQVRVSSQRGRGGRVDQERDSLKILSAKSIRKLSLEIHPDLIHLGSPSPWFTNLTELMLHSFLKPAVVQSILTVCSSLHTCSVKLFDRNSWGGDMRTPDSDIAISTEKLIPISVQLPELRKLSIQGLLVEITMLCRVLHAPSLTHILLYPPARPAPLTAYDEITAREVDVSYPPEETEILCSFLSQCTHLDSLTINPAYLYGAEIQAIFDCLPQIETLVLDNDWTHRPGDILTSTSLGTSTILGNFHYILHPLLKQERVSKIETGERIPLDRPLLPNLRFFSWNQFSQVISNELLVYFLKSRLSPRPMLEPPGASTDHSTRSLTEINIKLVTDSDIDIEAEIAQHARSVGLKWGIDFTLCISTYPWAQRLSKPYHQYVAPRASLTSVFSKVSADNLLLDYDVTWPLVEI